MLLNKWFNLSYLQPKKKKNPSCFQFFSYTKIIKEILNNCTVESSTNSESWTRLAQPAVVLPAVTWARQPSICFCFLFSDPSQIFSKSIADIFPTVTHVNFFYRLQLFLKDLFSFPLLSSFYQFEAVIFFKLLDNLDHRTIRVVLL